MKLLGQGLYWDELKVGDQFKTFGRTITEADIISFINCTGFLEVLFTDAEFREKHSAIAGRVAPAALVYCMAEGLLMVGLIQGTGLAFLNEVTVTEIRPTSKGGRGLVRTSNAIKNQRGETVIVYTPLRLLKGSEATA
jgi:acyl dehydratase